MPFATYIFSARGRFVKYRNPSGIERVKTIISNEFACYFYCMIQPNFKVYTIILIITPNTSERTVRFDVTG